MNKKTNRFLSQECLRRAGRTFLQTACGIPGNHVYVAKLA